MKHLHFSDKLMCAFGVVAAVALLSVFAADVQRVGRLTTAAPAKVEKPLRPKPKASVAAQITEIRITVLPDEGAQITRVITENFAGAELVSSSEIMAEGFSCTGITIQEGTFELYINDGPHVPEPVFISAGQHFGECFSPASPQTTYSLRRVP